MSHLTNAIKAGLNQLYCSHTGLPVGTIDEKEFAAYIDIEERLHGLDSDEDFLDSLHLALIPINNRPSPVFQNMTPTRYRLIAQEYPAMMTRYLLGRVLFERFIHGVTIRVSDGKALWLQSIPVDTEFSQETLETLIRIDGILSARKAFFSLEMKKELVEIQAEWPGLVKMEAFVEKLESTNMTYLANYNASADGRIEGNKMAQKAVLAQIRMVDDEAFAAEFAAREAGRILNEARREARAKESMNGLTQKFNKFLGQGQVETRRGVSAIISLATDMNGKIDKDLALNMISKLDFAKNTARQRIKNEKALKTVQKKPSTRKAKVVFDTNMFADFEF